MAVPGITEDLKEIIGGCPRNYMQFASKEEQQKWIAFRDKIKKHEDGHVDIATEYGKQLAARLKNLKGVGYSEKRSRAGDLADIALMNAIATIKEEEWNKLQGRQAAHDDAFDIGL